MVSTLELTDQYVELLDKYFNLDIIFNFEKACFTSDAFLMKGDVQNSSRKSVMNAMQEDDQLQEEDEKP